MVIQITNQSGFYRPDGIPVTQTKQTRNHGNIEEKKKKTMFIQFLSSDFYDERIYGISNRQTFGDFFV